MIGKLEKIRELSIIPGPLKLPEVPNSLSYRSEAKGSGGFGSVHSIISINGKGVPSRKYLLKIIQPVKGGDSDLAYKSIQQLHQKILKDHRTKNPLFLDHPELMGLPFMVFKAYDPIGEVHVTGMVMIDLIAYGYKDMGNQDKASFSFDSIERLESKIFVAYQFVRGIDWLHNHHFIHADIKPESLFVHPDTMGLAIIDFDGGFNYDIEKKGLTLGGLNQWLAPKIQKVIDRFSGAERELSIQERVEEETWQVACGIFEILFGVPPLFFLKSMDSKSIHTYSKSYAWPEVGGEGQLFNDSATSLHSNLLARLNAYRESGFSRLIEGFYQTFGDNLEKPSNRIQISEWLNLLKSSLDNMGLEPVVEAISLSKEQITFSGEEVEVEFRCKYFTNLKLNGSDVEPGESVVKLALTDSTIITISANSEFGSNSMDVSVEAVKKPPVILMFESSTNCREDLTPVKLSWAVANSVEVNLSELGDDVGAVGDRLVEPFADTEYILRAKGSFGEEVSSSLRVGVRKPEILSFDYRVNLEHGIENVEISWETEHATEVHISPYPGEVSTSGIAQIKLDGETELNLIAKGYFGEVNRSRMARPFPLPLIRELMVEYPGFTNHANIQIVPVELPKDLQMLPSVSIFNPVLFNKDIIGVSEVENMSFHNAIPQLGLPSVEKNWMQKTSDILRKKFQSSISSVLKK